MKDKNPDKLPVADKSRHFSFFQNVWDVVRQVPAGRVTTYGAIAAYLGAKSSARMVGWAMNNSFVIEPHVPAQRVVNRQGLLTGKAHFATPTEMEELLQKEGITINDNQVQNFSLIFWDPAIELQ